ncbi:MAG: glycosidase [Acidimicrobiaceae bacterium]|nr:glycosidase [Acidimicrobiaceae bacterium]
MRPLKLRPLSLVVEPDLDNPYEVGGLLNPAAARGPDGELYLFPRMVAQGNFSRIGILRVLFDHDGDPCGVERLGIALEPEMPYELRSNGEGGCEDPRVTYVEPLKRYVMTYTAFSPEGPRIALADSTDLFTWHRLGLATFVPHDGIEFNDVDNKDAAGFPQTITNPSGQQELAILHRPLFPGTAPDELVEMDGDRDVDLHRESIWISYTAVVAPKSDPHQLRHFTSHHRLAAPVSPWESLKIGSGTPPVMTRHGWLIVYHGVSDAASPDNPEHRFTYSAGVMVLSEEHPQHLLYRSRTPALVPRPSEGPRGTPSNVVFPTGIDRRVDIGEPHRYDVYYGIDDFRIGVARLDVPEVLPNHATKDPPGAVT